MNGPHTGPRLRIGGFCVNDKFNDTELTAVARSPARRSSDMREVLLLVITLTVTGCSCLDSVKIKPEANNVNIPTGTVGTIGIETEWKFKECCVQGEQKQIALGLQRQLADD